jgi:hypothetical protein
MIHLLSLTAIERSVFMHIKHSKTQSNETKCAVILKVM